MTIVINIDSFLPGYPQGEKNFMVALVRRMMANHPGNRYVLIGTPAQLSGEWPGETLKINPGMSAQYPITWKWWYDTKIPAILRKQQADVFISLNGIGSLGTKQPQCLFFPDPGTLEAGVKDMKGLFYYRRNAKKYLHSASQIITSPGLASKISEKYGVALASIKTILPAVDESTVSSFDEKEATREKFTSGKNYFIYTGDIGTGTNWINLLKAFSIFKKRQKTEWKLVLSGTVENGYAGFYKSLESYKYRDDVLMAAQFSAADISRLLAAAYAMIEPSAGIGFGVKLAEAMKKNIPVIACRDGMVEELAGSTVLYAASGEPAALADQMMLLYKDESLHRKLAEQASERAGIFSWDASAEQLWEAVAARPAKG